MTNMNVRRIRGLTEAIYLIHVDLFEESKTANFHIVGNTKRIYNVIITAPQSGITCSCMDWVLHHAPCKHVYFVTDKLLKIPLDTNEKELYDFDLLQSVVYTRVSGSSNLASDDAIDKYRKQFIGDVEDEDEEEKTETTPIKARNDECGVCYDDISQQGVAIMICNVCRNGIHLACWKHWSSVSKKNTCIYCKRQYVNPEDKTTDFKKDNLGYVVLCT
jgi:hypothetical protein